MKTARKTLLLLTAGLGLFVTAAFADTVKKQAGPNGGRILTSVAPHAELFVTKERKIQITFLDDHGHPVAPAGQGVTVTTGSRTAPVTLTFTRRGNALLSDTTLPDGNNLPAVIQLKPSADAAPVIERLHLNLVVCGECQHAEYACTCEGH